MMLITDEEIYDLLLRGLGLELLFVEEKDIVKKYFDKARRILDELTPQQRRMVFAEVLHQRLLGRNISILERIESFKHSKLLDEYRKRKKRLIQKRDDGNI